LRIIAPGKKFESRRKKVNGQKLKDKKNVKNLEFEESLPSSF
jgi:hypothetical protein